MGFEVQSVYIVLPFKFSGFFSRESTGKSKRIHYIPDFIVKISDKTHLILEVKGQKKDKDESKWDYMNSWIKAVSRDEENGTWHFAVSQDETGQSVHEIIDSILSKK